MRVLTGSHVAPSHRCTVSLACSVVSPVPRFFGRVCSGRRATSSRYPARVSSQETSVRVAASAWSLRSRFSSPRTPGTVP